MIEDKRAENESIKAASIIHIEENLKRFREFEK